MFPTGASSAASSSHSAALATVGSGPISRLGQLSYAASRIDEDNKAGQLPEALQGSRAGQSENALHPGNRANVVPIGPDGLAAVSHAEEGTQSLSVIPVQYGIASNDGMASAAFQNHVAANVQPKPAEMSQPLSAEAAVLTDAAAGSAAVGAPLQILEGTSQVAGVQQQPRTGLAVTAQPPGYSNADSSKSASGIILSPVSSAGHHDQSSTVSNADADAASSSGHVAAALGHPAAASGQQPQSQGPNVAPPQSSAQTCLHEAGVSQAHGQPQAAPGQPQSALGLPGAAPVGSQAEQRQLEEQEVLYNMTGQTGSLMYMAPEVFPIQLLKMITS